MENKQFCSRKMSPYFGSGLLLITVYKPHLSTAKQHFLLWIVSLKGWKKIQPQRYPLVF